MSLKERLMQDLQEAMRGGEELRKSTIRMARAAIKNAEIEKIGELDDAGVGEVLRKEIKQRLDSADEYKRGNRPELAEKEMAEVAVLEAYLPKQMSEAEIESEVRAIIAELQGSLQGGALGMQSMSKVMPVAMARMKDRANGRTINQVVTRLLSE